MSFSRKFGLFLSGFIFRAALFFGLTLLAGVMLISDRTAVKESLLNADAYTRYSEAVIESGKQQTQHDPNAIPLDDPRIESIIKQSLDSRSLQNISDCGEKIS